MAKKKKGVGIAGKTSAPEVKRSALASEKPKVQEQKKSESVPGKIKSQSASKLAEFAFGRENYKFLLIGLAFILVGFILMVGGGSDDPNIFSEDIFNFRRLTLAPILILIGYVIEIYAIMKKPVD
ncbi:MAG: DUF3098 domain-containing protein [Bacteroidales bacterium]|nr:DUF3098 domain-containing protein [Bacteroidales bacterium]